MFGIPCAIQIVQIVALLKMVTSLKIRDHVLNHEIWVLDHSL